MLKGLIVSCQAVEGEPLFGFHIMGIMAKAAVEGGANAIRTSGVSDIADVKKMVDVPVIGLIKRRYDDSEIYITPTLKEVAELCATSAEVIAMDMTDRARPSGETTAQLIEYIRRNAPEKVILADVSTVEEGVNAEKLGADYVSTTMRGYTQYTQGISIPDYDMIRQLKSKVNIPVIAEGGIWETSQLEKVLETGADCVVIGTAITRPKDITSHFKSVFAKRV